MSNTSSPRLDAERFDRYLAGECSPEEAAAMQASIARNPQLGALAQLALGAPAAHEAVDVAAAWRTFQATRPTHSVRAACSVRAPMTARSALPSTPRSRVRSRPWGGMVATLVAVALVVAGIGGYVRHRIGAGERVVLTRTYATTRAQRATVTFPDGSRVMLAPNSAVRYAVTANGARTAHLQGEAFFTVTHDPSAAFTVRTGAVETRVLGTEFTVRHYATESDVRVAVLSGKVATGSAGRGRNAPTVLTPGMAGVFTSAGAPAHVSTTATDATAWTRGMLVFTDTPVATMLAAVGQWYGYEFRLTDAALAKRAASATFSTADASETLATIRMLLDVSMTFDGNVVTLRPTSTEKKK